MKVGLLGKKIGMTRVYDATGKATPVTVIEAGGNSLLQTKTAEKDGYQAIQVGFDAQKESRLPKPLLGRSKGKGFQGVVKKHGFAGQPAAHGSKMHRRNGAIGNRSTPGRVWKNMGMPGHLGDDRVTVQNLRIVQVRAEDNVILIGGAVPGANGSYVVVRPAKKKPETTGTK